MLFNLLKKNKLFLRWQLASYHWSKADLNQLDKLDKPSLPTQKAKTERHDRVCKSPDLLLSGHCRARENLLQQHIFYLSVAELRAGRGNKPKAKKPSQPSWDLVSVHLEMPWRSLQSTVPEARWHPAQCITATAR